MPGIVVFRRRWSVGSDDLIVPAVVLILFHSAWLITLIVSLFDIGQENQRLEECQFQVWRIFIAFTVIWTLALFIEVSIALISLRGKILDDEPRWIAEFLLYIELALYLVEIGLTVVCILWLQHYYMPCPLQDGLKNVILGLVISNLVIFLTALMTLWCSWDPAGRSWVKLKKYQQSLKDQSQSGRAKRFQYKSDGGSSRRNWRQRKVRRAYQSSWHSRCQLLFCCVNLSKRKSRSSFADIARVLSEFFRDLDVVPSDVIVGLVLLRKRQQLLRLRTIQQPNNPVYQFLSGVKVTPDTRFIDDMDILKEVHHYMYYAIGVYGWPMYLRKNTGIAACKLCASLSCRCVPCCQSPKPAASQIVEDNCCGCNFAAYSRMCPIETHIIYITYHVDVGETPFLVAVDLNKKTIVVSIRGTLSLKDVLTDLNAEGEPLPIRPVNEEWIGHKGMVEAAAYIYKKVKEEHLLTHAFSFDKEAGTQNFDIVCVGHSLGAGTAAILAIMLKQEYPRTRCFAFSPPGGSLSAPAVEYSKEFITSVIVGKDVVPRIGLHQLEALRHDLIYAVHKSKDPKYKTLAGSLTCCGGGNHSWSETEITGQLSPSSPTAAININPWDSSINLTVHQPLYIPGKIIHLVRHHPEQTTSGLYRRSAVAPVYQAIWADIKDFDEVLISKRMVQDHMPDNVIDALDQLINSGKLGDPRAQTTEQAQLPSFEGTVPSQEEKISPVGTKQQNSGESLNQEKENPGKDRNHLENPKSLSPSKQSVEDGSNGTSSSHPLVGPRASSSSHVVIKQVISSETSVSVEVIKTDSTQQFVSSDSTQHHETVVHSKNGHFDPMYPAFTSQQVEYSSSPKHLEPFYRYRVYSDSSYC